MNFFDTENIKLHSDSDQLKRQKSALNLKMRYVDSLRQTGIIKNYSVSLSECTCVDFALHRKPCKHMYCLAMELGIFKVDEKSFVELENSSSDKKFKPHSVNYEYSLCEMIPRDFVVIDFETANQKFDSVCQMGVVVVRNNEIVDKKDFLIRPPYKNFTNSDIHGITFEEVKYSPTFVKLWRQTKLYIANNTIAAYNLFFD